MNPSAGTGRRSFWRQAFWNLLWPERRERTRPTISGTVLIGLSLGIGAAAYNSSSNILFIALSLLLSCLILSGVLAWLNLRQLSWRLEVEPPLRAGQEAEVGLVLRNGRRFLPTYALWFEFAAVPFEKREPSRPESTLTARGIDVWAVLAKTEASTATGTAYLRERLDPGAEMRLDWRFRPEKRGLMRVELRGIGSLFPFGFLRKLTGTDARRELHVWPAPVEYRRFAGAGPRRPSGDLRQARAGNEGDMIALRRYEPGDSHRLIHWKASARTGRLLIRQFSAQNVESCALWLDTREDLWTRAEQFELLLSFAGTLAVDLFRAGKLVSVAIDGGPRLATKRMADLDGFMDRLAESRPLAAAKAGAVPAAELARGARNLLVFLPDGPLGVAAFINGIKTAST